MVVPKEAKVFQQLAMKITACLQITVCFVCIFIFILFEVWMFEGRVLASFLCKFLLISFFVEICD